MPRNSRRVPQEHPWFYTEAGWGDKGRTGPPCRRVTPGDGDVLQLPPPREEGYVFAAVCLFICLSVC